MKNLLWIKIASIILRSAVFTCLYLCFSLFFVTFAYVCVQFFILKIIGNGRLLALIVDIRIPVYNFLACFSLENLLTIQIVIEISVKSYATHTRIRTYTHTCPVSLSLGRVARWTAAQTYFAL